MTSKRRKIASLLSLVFVFKCFKRKLFKQQDLLFKKGVSASARTIPFKQINVALIAEQDVSKIYKCCWKLVSSYHSTRIFVLRAIKITIFEPDVGIFSYV